MTRLLLLTALVSAPFLPSAAGAVPVRASPQDFAEQLAEQLAGAWVPAPGGEEDRVQSMLFDGDLVVLAWETNQSLSRVLYGEDNLVLDPLGSGRQTQPGVRLEGDALTLVYTVEGSEEPREVKLVRAAEIPEALLVDAFELGGRDPDTEEMEAIKAGLAARIERDQEPRMKLESAMTAAYTAGEIGTPEEQQAFMQGDEMKGLLEEMGAIDVANTHHLQTLVRDVGWIDPARFGLEANQNAFLIVQHSGNLRLMRTVLPRLEQDVKFNPDIGQSFALLFDRTQLALGERQRYGTQLLPSDDGTLRVPPLEQPDEVDALRAAMGMMPLEAYLDLFRRQGRTVVMER